MNRPEFESSVMLGASGSGKTTLVANLAAMALLRRGSTESLNVEGAYLEVLADTIGSVGVIIGAIAIEATGWTWIDTLIAVLIGYVIIRSGLAILRGMAAPIPEPPPPGELRKVKIQYRCAICGTEVRMTAAIDEDPDSPRHCMQEMDLVAPIE